MSLRPEVHYWAESRTDAVLLAKLLHHVGAEPGDNYSHRSGAGGKDALVRRLPGFLAASALGRAIVLLRDLDNDAPCAGALVAQLIRAPSSHLSLRIAVPTLDAWVLADRAGLSAALKLPLARLPTRPDEEAKPKAVLQAILSDARDPDVRQWLHEARGPGDLTPQVYAGWLSQHIATRWDPRRAIDSGASPSLTRSARSLARFVRDVTRSRAQ